MCNLLTSSELTTIRQHVECLQDEQVLTQAERDLIALAGHIEVLQKQTQIALDAIREIQVGSMADAQVKRDVLSILKEVTI